MTVNRGATLALDLTQFATFGNNVTNNGQIVLMGFDQTVPGRSAGQFLYSTTGSGATTLTGARRRVPAARRLYPGGLFARR